MTPETLRQPQTTRQAIRTVGILAALLALVAAGVMVAARLRGFTLDDAQAFIGAPLPGGAQAVQFASQDEFARVVWLRFGLPPDADPLPFVQAMGLDAAPREGFTPFPAANYTEAELAWWTPHTAAAFSGLYAIHQAKVYELLLDRSAPDTLMVYLRVYSL